MIKATDVNKIVDSIDTVLLHLEDLLPKSKSNSGKVKADIAARYWLWSRTSSFVKKSMDKVTKEAIKADVIFDPKVDPMPPGEERQVYSDGTTNIIVKTSQPSTRVDLGVLKHELRTARVKETVIEAAFEKATLPNAAPHRFIATLNEVDD